MIRIIAKGNDREVGDSYWNKLIIEGHKIKKINLYKLNIFWLNTKSKFSDDL